MVRVVHQSDECALRADAVFMQSRMGHLRLPSRVLLEAVEGLPETRLQRHVSSKIVESGFRQDFVCTMYLRFDVANITPHLPLLLQSLPCLMWRLVDKPPWIGAPSATCPDT